MKPASPFGTRVPWRQRSSAWAAGMVMRRNVVQVTARIIFVIPGRAGGASPESILPEERNVLTCASLERPVVMDSGFVAVRRPGMTTSCGHLHARAPILLQPGAQDL